MDRDDYIIVCGDFGFWSDTPEEEYWLDWLEKKPFTILWVDGNHENFTRLNELPVHEWHGGKVHFIRPHVIHLMRGQLHNIEGNTFFTMGGAQSHDIEDGILDPEEADFKGPLLLRRSIYTIHTLMLLVSLPGICAGCGSFTVLIVPPLKCWPRP